MRIQVFLIAVVVSLLTTTSTAFATDSAFFVAGGAETWVSPKVGAHGYLLLNYQKYNIFKQATFDATLNTDTVQLTMDNIKLGETLSFGGYLKGEALIAGLLQDYYVQGENDPRKAFNASYLQAGTYLKSGAHPHYLQLEISVRRWFFSETDQTSPALVLPANFTALEPRLRYTYWALEYDEATNQAHRHYWRVNGLAFGVELGMDWRNERKAWGALDSDAFDLVDNRNGGHQASFVARAWIRAGLPVTKMLRLQGMINGAVGQNQDDINRVRVGGMNPYVVPIAGLPWASYLPDKILASELTAHYKVLNNSEVGLMVHGALMSGEDILRTRQTEQTLDGLAGIGIFGDWRIGSWQVDTRFGWALPYDGLKDNPHLTAWLSVGKQIW